MTVLDLNPRSDWYLERGQSASLTPLWIHPGIRAVGPGLGGLGRVGGRAGGVLSALDPSIAPPPPPPPLHPGREGAAGRPAEW